MALVNPNIAMSFRQPEFTPRNALAEYAQIQQIQGGQRQAEVADMQLRRMRQEDEDIERIHQIAMKNGGPDSRMEMGRALFASRNKDQRELGYKIIQHEEAVRAYNSEFGPGAMAAPTMPKSAPGTMAMPSTPAPRTERGVDAYGKPFDAEVGGGIAPPGAMGQPLAPLDAPASANEPYPGYNASIGMPTPSANALAPTPTPSANALAPAPAAPNIDALRRQYGMAVAAGRSDAPVLLKQIEAALRGDQNKPLAVSRGQVVIDPRTGQQIFAAPEAPASLSDRFVPVGRLVFDRQTQQYISPSQAQLAQSQERPAAGGAAGGAGAGAGAAPKPMTPVQSAKRRDQLGKEFKAAQSALQTTQDVLDSIAFVKSEPGLPRATGFTGMLPSFSEGDAASAETRIANLRGKITALGKAAAASTGAIGSIANQEWKILADQIAAIDLVKGTRPLLDQLDLVEAQAQGAMERIRDGYQRQFGEDFERFPQYSDLPPPKSSFKPRASAGGKPAAGGATGGATGGWSVVR
jgi:hypothetical protein